MIPEFDYSALLDDFSDAFTAFQSYLTHSSPDHLFLLNEEINHEQNRSMNCSEKSEPKQIIKYCQFSETEKSRQCIEPQNTQKVNLSSENSQILELVPNLILQDRLKMRMSHTEMWQVSIKRKQQLFSAYMKRQTEKNRALTKKYGLKYPNYDNDSELKSEGEIFLLTENQKKQILTLTRSDFDKLIKQTDLNDTVINNYLKIVQTKILPEETSSQTYIFSTFFMTKLFGNIFENQERQIENKLIALLNGETQFEVNKKFEENVKNRVRGNYQGVKRWVKKVNLFQKKYLVFPINAYKHWNCIIVILHKNQSQQSQKLSFELILLDSMFEMKTIFSVGIRAYLELIAEDKNKIENNKYHIDNVQTRQLITPRQKNNHDCGLFTLCYIEYFLMSPERLTEKNIEHLDIFPNTLIYCIRHLIRKLFNDLLEIGKSLGDFQSQNYLIRKFIEQKQEIIKESDQEDYESIDSFQWKKYRKLHEGEFLKKIQEQCKKNQDQQQNEQVLKVEEIVKKEMEVNEVEVERKREQREQREQEENAKEEMKEREQEKMNKKNESKLNQISKLKFYYDVMINVFDKESPTLI